MLGGTFVSVGNATQPFPRLLRAVETLARDLPQPVTVQFGRNAFASPACQCVAFLDMETFASHIHQSDLLILHAGAGSIINAIYARKYPVLVPRRACYGELVDDHQLELARKLAAADRALVVEDVGGLKAATEVARRRQTQISRSVHPPALVSAVKAILVSYARQFDA